MDTKFEWRILSKIVAIIQLFLAAIALLFLLYLVLIFGNVTKELKDFHYETGNYSKNDSLHYSTTENYSKLANPRLLAALWLLLGLGFIAIAVELWAGITLHLASRKGRDPIDAQAKARIWQITTIIFIVLHFFHVILVIVGITPFNARFIVAIVVALVRFLFLYVVYRFVKELENVAKMSQNSEIEVTFHERFS